MEKSKVIRDYIEGKYTDYCAMSRRILLQNDYGYLCSEDFRNTTKELIATIKESKLDEKIQLFRSQKIFFQDNYMERQDIKYRNIIYSDEIYIGAILPMGIVSFSSDENVIKDMNEGDDPYVHSFNRELNGNMGTVEFKIITDEALPIYEYAGEEYAYQKEYLMYGYFQVVGEENGAYILEKIPEKNAGGYLLELKQRKEDKEKEIEKQKEKIRELEKELHDIDGDITDQYEYLIQDINEIYNMDKAIVSEAEIKSCHRFKEIKSISEDITYISNDDLYDGFTDEVIEDLRVYIV